MTIVEVMTMQNETMGAKLEVILTQTAHRKPLVTVNNFPGLYTDLTPAYIRALAAALCRAADEGERQPMGRKDFKQKKRVYDLIINKRESLKEENTDASNDRKAFTDEASHYGCGFSGAVRTALVE